MKIKILFYISQLGGGGAERTLVNIVNNIDNNLFNCVLVLASSEDSDYIHLVNDSVRIGYLNSTRHRDSVFSLTRVIKEEDPSLLFSTININNLVIILAKLLSFKPIPVIVREANNRTQSGRVTSLNKWITYVLYNYFTEKVVSLSEGVKNDLVENFYIKESKIINIYNPVEIEMIDRLKRETIDDLYIRNDEKFIIGVGRLTEQKDFKTLIRAFHIVCKKINSKLVILGKGPEEYELKKLCNSLGISDKVLFMGFKTNPYKYMYKADVFVLSSKWEGFGHVIVEAMATETPVISTNCNSGPAEIIKNNRYGILTPVGQEKELANEIINLLIDNEKIEKLAKLGRYRAEKFSAKIIGKRYQDLFYDCIK